EYVKDRSVIASSGYDATTGEASPEDDERGLPSAGTRLVSPDRSKVLAGLEADGNLHLPLVYRGSPANTAKFTEAQNKVIAALYPAEVPQDSSSEPKSQESEESTASETPAESEVQ
ncbi:pilus assembly protein CpaB, partial [Bacteroides xylanolyticus]|nr:pilus assembly protein CpaB [Lacrimispora defluvii]